MEELTLEYDIKVLCVEAESFPDGIAGAHEKLRSLVPLTKERRYFGISRPNESYKIVYKAGAEQLEDNEAENLNCETFVIESGNYIAVEVKDYRNEIQIIGETFQNFLSHPEIDPKGCCVEWYLNEHDVRCMVRLNR